ncbi:peptidoglycan-binding protein [Kitasatospora sp. NPDC098652]|uniref:peptidoglycan-binding protein n=1 Tax=Kitasatospora sp. NPDC098652 TaxID=3364095 RepID=UPI0038077F00
MPDIEIDTSRLTVPRFTVPEAGAAVLDGSTAPPPTVTLPVGEGFHLQQGGLPPADLVFAVRADATVDFDPALDTFLSGRGTRRLTVLGLPVTLDSTALGHALVLDPGGAVLAAGASPLVLLPAADYRLLVPSVSASLSFGVARNGAVGIDAATARFATATGPSLAVQGFTVTVDGRDLAHDLYPTHSGTGLPNDAPHRLQLIPGTGYGFQAGPSGPVSGFRYDVGPDGAITLSGGAARLDARTNGFASVVGATLTVHGYDVTVDGRALSHDLLSLQPQLLLPRDVTHRLRVIPADGYGFQAGTSLTGCRYDLRLDGTVDYPADCDGFQAGRGTDSLVVLGYPLVVDAEQADSDLVDLAPVGVRAQSPRRLFAVVAPAPGYLPRTANGPFTTPFTVGQDGTVSFPTTPTDPAPAGFYATPPDPAPPGQEVTLEVAVLPDDPAAGSPQATVTFTEAGVVLGAARPDATGVASLGTTALSIGDHQVTAVFPGDDRLAPSTTVLHHRIEAAAGTPDPLTAASALLATADQQASQGLTEAAVTSAAAAVDTLDAFVPPTDQAGPRLALYARALTGLADRLVAAGRPVEAEQPAEDAVQALDRLAVLAPALVDPTVNAHARQLAATLTQDQTDPGGPPVPDRPLPAPLDWSALPLLAQMADPHLVDGAAKLAQALLNAAGTTPALTVDGNVGPLTRAALESFQKGRRLPVTGTTDTRTWYELALVGQLPLLEAGPRTPEMAGPPVAVVQDLLNQAGATPQLTVDGRFTADTDAAVLAFQTRRGLPATNPGKVSPAVWAALAAVPIAGAATATMRLTFACDPAAQGQTPRIRFVSREDLAMTCPLGADPPPATDGLAGFWFELRGDQDQVLYRRSRHQPVPVLAEVPGDGDDGSLRSPAVDSPQGGFELLAPVLPGARKLVVFSSPLRADALDQPATEVLTVPLTGGRS